MSFESDSKSRVRDLYSDSIEVDEVSKKKMLSFVPFVGIAPRRYQEMFQMVAKRKDGRGEKQDWDGETAPLRVERNIETYLMVENSVVEFLTNILEEKGLIEPPGAE